MYCEILNYLSFVKEIQTYFDYFLCVFQLFGICSNQKTTRLDQLLWPTADWPQQLEACPRPAPAPGRAGRPRRLVFYIPLADFNSNRG